MCVCVFLRACTCIRLSLPLSLSVCVFLCKWKMDRECWNKRCTWLWNGMWYGGSVVVVWNLFILLVFSSGYKRSTHKLNVLKRTERDTSNRLCFRHSYKSFVTNERLCTLNGNREKRKKNHNKTEGKWKGKKRKKENTRSRDMEENETHRKRKIELIFLHKGECICISTEVTAWISKW